MADFFSFYAFFEVCCFIFLIYCFYKLFQAKGLVLIKDGLLQKEKAFNLLKQKNLKVKKETQQVITESEQKNQLAEQLLKKIKVWNQEEQKKNTLRSEQKEQSEKEAQDYLNGRIKWLEIDYTRREVMPDALEALVKELKAVFKNSEKQEEFLDTTVKMLSKEKV